MVFIKITLHKRQGFIANALRCFSIETYEGLTFQVTPYDTDGSDIRYYQFGTTGRSGKNLPYHTIRVEDVPSLMIVEQIQKLRPKQLDEVLYLLGDLIEKTNDDEYNRVYSEALVTGLKHCAFF